MAKEMQRQRERCTEDEQEGREDGGRLRGDREERTVGKGEKMEEEREEHIT